MANLRSDAKVVENGKGAIVVQWSEFKGRKGLDIRKFYTDRESGELKPTRKGIWIGEGQVNDVFNAMQDLIMDSAEEPDEYWEDHGSQ